MRQRIKKVMPLVMEHMQEAQCAQQQTYNCKAQPCEFQILGILAGSIHCAGTSGTRYLQGPSAGTP